MQQAIYSNFPITRLLKWEWQRLIRTDLILLVSIFMVFLIVIGYSGTVELFREEGSRQANPVLISEGLPSISKLFVLFFVILSLGADFSQGTMRKRLLSGYARIDLFATAVMLLTGAIVLFSMMTIVAFGLVQLLRGVDLFYFWNHHLVANLLFSQLIAGCFGILLISLFQKTGMAIVFYFLTTFVESGLSLAFMFAWQIPDYSFFLPLSGTGNATSLKDFLWYHDLVPAFWIGFFLWISWWKFKTTEF